MAALSLSLGESVNLLFGFRPTWNAASTGSSPAYPPTTPATQTFAAEIADLDEAAWSLPTVTLHADAESLISELYGYRVLAFQGDETGFSAPAGVLVFDDADRAAALAAASAYVGVDLTQPYSFMLVKLERAVGAATHEFVENFAAKNRDEYLTPEARTAFAALEPGTVDTENDVRLSAAQAQAYVAAFYQYGTHFVSRIYAGDAIWQVFAYTAEDFADLQHAFAHDSGGKDRISGMTALSYAYFTTPVNTGTGQKYGYTSATGPVKITSGDPLLAASLAKGDWKDDRNAGGNSVFAIYHNVNALPLLQQFTQVAPIGVEFTPIGSLIPISPDHYRAQWWNRLFKGALIQKYGSRIRTLFQSSSQLNWQAMFPQSADSWLSTIATPTIDVYQERVDLAGMQLINTEAVQTFTVFSQVLQVNSAAPVPVPGSRVTLVSHVIDTSARATIPALQFTDSGYQNLVISCGEMSGALLLTNASGQLRRTVVDGFVFSTSLIDAATGRWTVALTQDIHAAPSETVLSSLVTSLQFSLVTAESLLYGRGSGIADTQQFMVNYLTWLAAFLPEVSENPDLQMVRVQALYLARVARKLGTEGVTVPYLRYATYQPYVSSIITTADALGNQIQQYQQQIRDQKQAELTITTAQQLNDNIKKTGGLLTSYFGVLAKNQSDMASFYGSIAAQKQNEFDKAVTNTEKLRTLIDEQQQVVDSAVTAFQKAMVEWETEEIIKFALQVATDVFSLGVAFAVPATDIVAVKSLGETAQKIQKVLNILNALAKLTQGVEKEIRTLQGITRTLENLNSDVDLPSSREWQEFGINLDASLAAVPTDPGPAQAKANLSAAFKILALRGQAWLDAQGKQRQLLTDLYYNKRLQDLNNAQAQRLQSLTTALHLNDINTPDVSSIDLVGLTGQTQFQLKQILTLLARTLILQDAAVQYEYLGQPAAIEKFDLISLKTVMMVQQGNIINALQQFNPPPAKLDSPIVYRINAVPVAALTKGQIYETIIQPSATEFFRYAMARVNRVVVGIEGVAGSDGGQYLMNVTYQGNPFEDRNPLRETITFNTVSRHFGPYLYNNPVAGGDPLGVIQFGDDVGTIGANISEVTPFSAWQFSLPDTSTNKGLKFNAPTVNIVLRFYLTALLVDSDAKALLRRRRLAARPALTFAVTTATDPTASTLDNLLSQMYASQAVLKGWDVVFNLMEGPVNDFLAAQYKAKHQDDSMQIEVGFCQDFGGFSGYTKFGATLSSPLMQFEQNNHDFVTVKQQITAGYIQTGSRAKPPGGCKITDPDVNWDPKQPLDVSSKPFIQGSVALSQVQGLVQSPSGSSNTRSVILDFAQGSFVAQNLKVTTDDATLNAQLSNYFQTTEIKYVINTVSFDAPGQLPALQPGPFKLNVLTTNSGKNVLQLFITTTGKQQNNLTINVNEPIPDNYDNSLMVNTRIMFDNIFVQSFNQGGTNIQVASVNPGQDFLAWSAKVTTGAVNGSLDFNNKDGQTQYRIRASDNNIAWDIPGLLFQRDIQQGVVLNYSGKKNVPFQYRQYYRGQAVGRGQYIPAHYGDWQDSSVDVNVSMNGHYPITVAGAGKLQTIQIANLPPDVTVDNTDLKPTGPCECNDNDLKIRVRDELKKDIPAAIQKQMQGIVFQAISIFALENLLFPAENFIQMKNAYVPGDLLVLGVFNQSTT